jgi:hypothetical protein
MMKAFLVACETLAWLLSSLERLKSEGSPLCGKRRRSTNPTLLCPPHTTLVEDRHIGLSSP